MQQRVPVTNMGTDTTIPLQRAVVQRGISTTAQVQPSIKMESHQVHPNIVAPVQSIRKTHHLNIEMGTVPLHLDIKRVVALITVLPALHQSTKKGAAHHQFIKKRTKVTVPAPSLKMVQSHLPQINTAAAVSIKKAAAAAAVA